MQNEQRLRQREAEFEAMEAPYGRQTAEQHAAAEKRTGRRLPRGRPVDEETGKLLEYGEYLKGLSPRNEPFDTASAQRAIDAADKDLGTWPEAVLHGNAGQQVKTPDVPGPARGLDVEDKKNKERRERMLRRRRMGIGKF
tara:strand:+ start:65 stop:484 length:420 start_codon:yes stop_codon:yes gene_type:complete